MTNTLIPPTPSDSDYAQAHAAHDGEIDSAEPFDLFAQWLFEARKSEINDPNAMALATADADGMPDVRMVLLKDCDTQGFVFYTNLRSAKGLQLASNPQAALLFHWKSLRRQVRARGRIEPVTPEEADAYFVTRARQSQIGAWASDQSKTLESRFALEKRVGETALRYGIGPVPRPPHWSGFRLIPQALEFWRDRPFRLHDRVRFTRAGSGWSRDKLYP